ncbi:MAG: cytochrome-c oxidase, cbb3-type subunit I [Phycisphaerales bacterium]|nr:cytochrome-c oxidase, cbb3-type subunit I [Planctomycetota bacterium]MCH8508477.1 cytochrome-c oxidase, cbb3-type subunit I [Phycisphaerales bacterium]
MSEPNRPDAARPAVPPDPATPVSRPGLEAFRYDDAIVRMFAWATVIWGIVAFLVGLIIAVQLAFPAANLGLPWTSFGRLRPLHTNAAIFAFAGNAIFAAVYYSTQRLCKARMWSDRLSRLHFWGWQAIIVSAALTLPFGITQGKEYAELEWPIDIAIAVVWVGFFGVNFLMTLIKRRERHMYVALWFYIATIVTVAMLHVFNNLWIPVGVVHFARTGEVPSIDLIMKSYPVYAGVQDALMQWWYGHNAVAFFLTTPFLGLMYYFLPKAAERPVFSYKLSIIHFWSLVFIYIWAGPHHLHYTALPQWASTLGMVFSIMLWMPSWGGMINGLLTLRGAWHKVASDPVLKFFVVGITFYGMATFEGPMLSVKLVNQLSHYTDWTIAHVHSAALGWNGFLTFGMLYWMMPRLFQTELYSKKLATAHFWIATVGIALYVLSIYAAGVTQGLMWRAFDATGRLQYPSFIETVVVLLPMYWIRVLGGTLYLIGALIGLYNFIQTWRNRPEKYEDVVHYAAPLKPVDESAEPKAKGDIFQANWHRKWERLPVFFTVATLIAVGIGSVISQVPLFVIKSNIPTIATVTPYSPLELAGRDIYIAEGCYNCHSQMIRPLYAETVRYGEYSKPGEFIYDRPFQWGSRRIGPDLAREGVTNPNAFWHWQHFENPTMITPGSIMPPYPWLLTQEVRFNEIQSRVDAMAMMGAPYGELIIGDNAVRHARAQARRVAKEIESQGGPPASDIERSKAVALIAYLQRLGTDLYRDEPLRFTVPPEEGEEDPSDADD